MVDPSGRCDSSPPGVLPGDPAAAFQADPAGPGLSGSQEPQSSARGVSICLQMVPPSPETAGPASRCPDAPAGGSSPPAGSSGHSSGPQTARPSRNQAGHNKPPHTELTTSRRGPARCRCFQHLETPRLGIKSPPGDTATPLQLLQDVLFRDEHLTSEGLALALATLLPLTLWSSSRSLVVTIHLQPTSPGEVT